MPDLHMRRVQAALLPKPAALNKTKAKKRRTHKDVAQLLIYAIGLLALLLLALPARAYSATPDQLEKAVAALKAAKPGSEEQKFAGQRLCNLASPPSVATWPNGELVCARIKQVVLK